MRNRPKLLLSIALVAIVGCLVGELSAGGTAQSSSSRTAYVPVGGLLLEYPASWHLTSKGPAFPGLHILSPIVLIPGGTSAGAGLLAGQLADSQQSPLPQSFLAGLPRIPQGELVQGSAEQAYRYRLHLGTGEGRLLELYVLPSLGENAMALACYATTATATRLHECQQIVATATQPSSSEGSAPDGHFAARLRTLVAVLEHKRRPLRTQLSSARTLTDVFRPAAALARMLTAAARSVVALEAPPPLPAARNALGRSLREAGSAFLALEKAARFGDGPGYVAALRRIGETEQGVDRALARFAILGYTPGPA